MASQMPNRLGTCIYSIPDAKLPSIASSSASSSDIADDDSSSTDLALRRKFILPPDASMSQIQETKTLCKTMINESNECSKERKWLVRYLVELRLREQQILDVDDKPYILDFAIMGHHLELKRNTAAKQYCDHCSGVIWNVIQGCYVCKDCNYKCHPKCVSSIHRVCAHVVATEKGELLMTISPENGLASQGYKCAECLANLSYVVEPQWTEPRLCDYTGLYYCTTCHWNNTCEIPARVVHNWDWEKKPVSQASLQLLTITNHLPLIDLDIANDKLYSFVTELDLVRKLRKDLKVMMKYLVECKTGNSLVTREILNAAETPRFYSMKMLELVKEGLLESQLSVLVENCRYHITTCPTCSGKGYLCEICGNDEIIFPFDSAAIGCEPCNSYFHRACWTRALYNCPKCARLEERNISECSNPL